MDSHRLGSLVALLDAQVKLARTISDAQRDLVEELRRRGLPTGEAETTLTVYETAESMRQAELASVLRQCERAQARETPANEP